MDSVRPLGELFNGCVKFPEEFRTKESIAMTVAFECSLDSPFLGRAAYQRPHYAHTELARNGLGSLEKVPQGCLERRFLALPDDTNCLCANGMRSHLRTGYTAGFQFSIDTRSGYACTRFPLEEPEHLRNVAAAGTSFARLVPEPIPATFVGACPSTVPLPSDVDEPVEAKWKAAVAKKPRPGEQAGL
jgi:hypothetical protein